MARLPDSLERIVETFDFLDAWEDRNRYISELGEQLPPLPDRNQIADNRVEGCMSKVWLVAERRAGKPATIALGGDGDTPVIKGIVAILLAPYSGKTARETASLDADELFNRLGIYDHLSPNRHCGVYAMVEKIKQLASETLSRAA